MRNQELKKLKRSELLQIMIAQSKRINAQKKQIDELERQLADRTIQLEEAGNIAKAALRLNHIFEDAQAAADQYLYNIRKLAGQEDAPSAEPEAQETEEEDISLEGIVQKVSDE